MNVLRRTSLIAMLAASVAWSAPAAAQRHDDARRDRSGHSDRDRGGQNSQAGQRQARPRDQGRAQGAQPQSAPPPASQGARRVPPQQERRAAPPQQERRAAPPQQERRAAPPDQQRRAVPRGGAVPPRARAYREPRPYGYDRPRARVPVIVYPRPYYVFRPRYWIGFGIYLGVLVPYPLAYGPPTYIYGYPEPYAPPPPSGSYGGISFEVIPDNAAVSVDGVWVGEARDFSPAHQPLTLTPGRHHVELQAGGMPPVAFDVDVIGGEVTPFRGSLRPY